MFILRKCGRDFFQIYFQLQISLEPSPSNVSLVYNVRGDSSGFLLKSNPSAQHDRFPSALDQVPAKGLSAIQRSPQVVILDRKETGYDAPCGGQIVG